MVRWLHPAQFIRASLDAIVAAVFGTRADQRLVEAMVRPQEPYFDYSNLQDGQDALWLDYVADTGDGWNSTYCIARLLALAELTLQTPEGTGHATQRGQVLVFGGDTVYPGASRETYEERLVQPYEAALRRSPPPSPDLFVIPGNHDWYDGLAAFLRLFCARRWVAGRRTRQSRSYFALKLPRGWWLLGTDVQLNSDIDVPQVEYFRQVASRMEPTDRVILCNAEPAWIHAANTKRRRGYLENNLEYLQEKVLGKRISVFLAGDLHHYRRHENPEGQQKITAGGGGAFLHPTHAPKADVLLDGYTVRKSFPDEKTSRKIARGNLLLIRHSPLFGLITGTLYLSLALAAYAEVGHLGFAGLPDVLSSVAYSMITRPWSMGLGIITLLSLGAFADAAFGRWKWVMGLSHGLGHIVAAFFCAWGGTYLTVSGLDICAERLATDPTLCAGGWPHLAGKFFLSSAFTFLFGFLVGPFVSGLYFWVSVNGFLAHSNEAFGALAVADYKNFLRLKIDTAGCLTIYPVGVERVPRQWKETHAGPSHPAYAPDDPDATEPYLIEAPIRVNLNARNWTDEGEERFNE
ncbi:metallophosphoesterase [Stigmatella hybrida]|uniref:metallophosphoesterase n=1 Tax=Stigmatella hybrida TaxID=394097 RepID=UPI001CDA75B2|nr:metallophosphoesterase [Stigmatella hybrida]